MIQSEHNPLFRFVFGMTIILSITIVVDFPLAFYVSVLSLSMIGPGKTRPTLLGGGVFISFMILAVGIGYFLSLFVEHPFVLFGFMAFFQFFILRSKYRRFKLFGLLGIVLFPLVAINSSVLAYYLSLILIIGFIGTSIVIQITYLIFPDPPGTAVARMESDLPLREREKNALKSTLVTLPLIIYIYVNNMASDIVVLIFAAILSMIPSSAINKKAGLALILANILGGFMAYLVYEVLVITPNIPIMFFLIMLIFLWAGHFIYAGTKYSPLYSLAITAFCLILGFSGTITEVNAGTKLLQRIGDISLAVAYVVIMLRFMEALEGKLKNLSLKNQFRKKKQIDNVLNTNNV